MKMAQQGDRQRGVERGEALLSGVWEPALGLPKGYPSDMNFSRFLARACPESSDEGEGVRGVAERVFQHFLLV